MSNRVDPTQKWSKGVAVSEARLNSFAVGVLEVVSGFHTFPARQIPTRFGKMDPFPADGASDLLRDLSAKLAQGASVLR